jgi:hypothetical protein
MVQVRSPPTEEARTIFDELGYRIVGDGHSFRARREWKEVEVTALGDPEPPEVEVCEEASLCCFVTWESNCTEWVSTLAEMVGGEWALIAVDEGGGYEVAHRST